MRRKQHETTVSGDLFRVRLEQIINMKHELAQFRWQARLGVDRQRDRAAIQRPEPAGDRDPLRDRTVAAQVHLWPVRRRHVRALGA